MKKTFILILYFLTVFASVQAQIYVGGNVGVNFSGIRFDDKVLQQSFRYYDKIRYGINTGINGDFYFSKILSVDADLAYSQKGYAYEQTYSQGYKQFEYVQISANGKLDLNPDSKVIFSPYVGTYGAFWAAGKRMKSNYKTGIIYEDKITLSSDTTYSYNRYDTGIIGGFEVKFKINYKRYFTIGIKYEHGMISTDIEKVDGWKNKNLSLYTRLLFRIKK